MTKSSSHHSFDVNLAAKLSIEEAIMIHHFQHWITINKRLNRNFHEERTWTYQTQDEITAHFPYWDRYQVIKIINKLVEKKILTKGNFNKVKFDRTVWYAFVEEPHFISAQSIVLNSTMESAKEPNGVCQIAPPIPDSIPDSKTSNKEGSLSLTQESPPIEKKVEKNALEGRFEERLFIKMDNWVRIVNKYGTSKADEFAEKLFRWSFNNEAKFKKYKRHDLVIEDWIEKEKTNISSGMPKTQSETPLNSAQGANLTQNMDFVEKTKKYAPKRALGLYLYRDKCIFRDKEDSGFGLSGTMEPKDFERQLKKHLGIET